MRPIDADALINEIKKETEKAIEQDDKVGSFWLGYIAGLVIKQPTIQSALDPEALIRTIETGITATNSSDVYSLGMRNGMRWCKSLIDGAEPKFEDDVMSVDDGKELPTIQPEKAQLSQEDTTSDQPVATDTNVGNNSEIPNSSDAVSRQAAIDAVEKNACNTQRIMDAVNNLPSAQPEPSWIPVSERLPEESGCYIITAYDGVGHRTTFAKFQKKAKSWDLTGARSYWRVIAWMPLPEPYKPNNE